MIAQIYTNYFAKDKPLRHYTQHFFIGIIGLLVTYALLKEITVPQIIYFFLATYIIDIDGVLSMILFRKRYPEMFYPIKEKLKEKNLFEAAAIAVRNHKVMDRLFLHNVLGLLLVVSLLMIHILLQNITFSYIFAAIFSHFLFDILDDFTQIGHIRNWLWK